MDSEHGFDVVVQLSPRGEDGVRPIKAVDQEGFSLAAIRNRVDRSTAHVLACVVESFGIPGSGVGLVALLDAIQMDLLALAKVWALPEWAQGLSQMRLRLADIAPTDPVRDLISLRSQSKSPLRDFLTPLGVQFPADQQRAIRALRGLAALRLLSVRERLPSTLADEFKRWLDGKTPTTFVLADVNAKKLYDLRASLPIESLPARLLTFVIEALAAKLDDPFEIPRNSTAIVLPISIPSAQASSDQNELPTNPTEEAACPDPLRSFLAEAGTATARVFSGVPNLFRCLLPEEVELIVPRIVSSWHASRSDECLAALMTLFTRVLPSGFARIPLSASDGAGLWLDLQLGAVRWNLDETIASHRLDKPFVRCATNRYVAIPLPIELVHELRRRAAGTANLESLAVLIGGAAKDLARRTKQLLRSLALSSHRPTLTRLARSWGRYVLSLCADEAYACAIGLDFTLGTTANLNYVLLRGDKVTSLVQCGYGRIGFSGRISAAAIRDIGSLKLPDVAAAGSYVRSALSDVHDQIANLPRNTTVSRLRTAHNAVATKFYAVFKLLLGGRALEEETITRSRVDPQTGFVTLTDKRTAPYHERRICCLPPSLRAWLDTYLAWLRLVGYRLAVHDPLLAARIASQADASLEGDLHPLFFRFTETGQTVPLGAADLADAYCEFEAEPNCGRHLLDWLFRNGGLDSSAIGGWMGRGNPGQEICGQWSAVVPLDYLAACARTIEDWLDTHSLPKPPALKPRQLARAQPLTGVQRYVPQLLLRSPPKNDDRPTQSSERCPFDDDTTLLASYFPLIFKAWRSSLPPQGWVGLALSLVLEDGVVHEDELHGALLEFQTGEMFCHRTEYFLDCKLPALGIRRIWLSTISVRLLFRLPERIGNVSMVDIQTRVANFITAIVPASHGLGLRFLLRCTKAYQSLRMPALLFSWNSGMMFARTSRPQTVARQLLGCCEPPSFERRRGTERRQHVKQVQQALSNAEDAVKKGGAHMTALAHLAGRLTDMVPDLEPDSHEWFSAGYLLHLAKTQRNIWSVSRYFVACWPFLQKVVGAVAEMGLARVIWPPLISSCLSDDDAKKEDSPVRAAINHCLEWLGVDIRAHRRAGPPPSALNYADKPSQREGALAVALLRAKQSAIGDDWNRAAAALQLMLDQALRWDEVAALRQCDVVLGVNSPHIVISRESGANLKSSNAPRVLLLDDAELAKELQSICELRAARFPGDPLVPIFGDEPEKRGRESCERIRNLVSDALWHASGSPVIRPHDSRGSVVSRRIGAALDVTASIGHDGFLPLRQELFTASARAGHSPEVSVEDYCHDLDRHRRRWIDKINDAMACHPRPAFLEGVTGISSVTYRKRESRNGSLFHDVLEGFDSEAVPKAGGTVRSLSSLVCPGLHSIEWDEDPCAADQRPATAKYLGLRLLGDPQELARLTARLDLEAARKLEKALVLINRRRPTPLRAHDGIGRQHFLDALSRTGLTIAMAAAPPPLVVLQRLVASIGVMGEAWAFSHRDDVLELNAWFRLWPCNHVSAEIVMKRSDSSAVDDYFTNRCKNAGISRVRTIRSSNFRRGVEAMLKFHASRDTGSARQPRASPQLTFLIGVSALALVALSQGES